MGLTAPTEKVSTPRMSPDHRSRDPLLWAKDLRRDLAYGVRALARTRGFSAVAMITLALGIGAVTVIYSVLRNVP